MKTPPSNSDGNTVKVGSGRRAAPEASPPLSSPPPPSSPPPGSSAGPASDDKTRILTDQDLASEDKKTTYISAADLGSNPASSPSPPEQMPLRPAPQSRIPWPARDERRPHAGNEAQEPHGASVSNHQPAADDKTRLFKAGSVVPATENPEPEAAPAPAPAPQPQAEARPESSDPVVGWLVIIEGPGKGRSIEIGIGANAIGRDRSQKISLNFGDAEIHRERHAVLIFDPRSRRFFLQSGDVRNLTYLGEELVLTPVELKGGETIIVGQTHLRFVAFCGPDFGWS